MSETKPKLKLTTYQVFMGIATLGLLGGATGMGINSFGGGIALLLSGIIGTLLFFDIRRNRSAS